MPDRSLLFFYGLVFAAVIYFIVKFRKDITKKDGLINIALFLVVAITIMFLLNSDLSATGILITIFSFLSAGFVFLCAAIFLKDLYSTKKYTLTAIKRIKTENTINFKAMPEFKGGIFCYQKSWYAIYSPSLNLLEIGVNAFFSMAEILSAMNSISDLNSLLLHMRPPNPQFSVPPGAVCRGAIVDQAIQGFFDQSVDALAVAGQRPVG
ncbi:Uncharacterised protein [Serratia marcescens]|nr:Uncharacterised protein [Serratia marcescens]CAI2072785.1 Uncharacterised protein [Serratia marcescens]